MPQFDVIYPPAVPDLDHTVLHSPVEIRAWKTAVRDRANEIIRLENEAVQALVAKEAKERSPLSEEEYYREALQRQAERDAKALEDQLRMDVAEQARLDFLESSPETLTITENNPSSFFVAINHWVRDRGYSLDTIDVRYFIPGCYSAGLLAPNS